MYHYTDCGLRNVWLENGYIEKDTPYGKAVAIMEVEALHKAIGLDLVDNKARLTGAEVRFLRKELDLSQCNLAESLGVSESTVRAWETHRTKIPKVAERYLKIMYKSSFDKGSDISKLIERIAHLDRKKHEQAVKFTHKNHKGWTGEIAAA